MKLDYSQLLEEEKGRHSDLDLPLYSLIICRKHTAIVRG